MIDCSYCVYKYPLKNKCSYHPNLVVYNTSPICRDFKEKEKEKEMNCSSDKENVPGKISREWYGKIMTWGHENGVESCYFPDIVQDLAEKEFYVDREFHVMDSTERRLTQKQIDVLIEIIDREMIWREKKADLFFEADL